MSITHLLPLLILFLFWKEILITKLHEVDKAISPILMPAWLWSQLKNVLNKLIQKHMERQKSKDSQHNIEEPG